MRMTRMVASDTFVTDCNQRLLQRPRREAEAVQVLNEGNKYDIGCLEGRSTVCEQARVAPAGMMGFYKWP